MAGQASGGQQLTPNPNVFARASLGGDVWGANGGGATAIGGGVAGQAGWDERIAPAQSRGQTAANYEITSVLELVQPSGITGMVASLLHFENGVIDTASPPPVWTAGGTIGTASVSNNEAEFGSQSLFLSGSDCYISSPQVSGGNFDLTAINFTVECWVFPTATTFTNAANNGRCHICDFSGANQTLFTLIMNNSDHLQVNGLGATGNWVGLALSSVATLNENAWNHVTVTRQGNTVYLGLNGVLVSGSVRGNAAAIPASSFVYIGDYHFGFTDDTGWDGGYIDEWRVITGQALYTGTSYTVPTAPSGDPFLGTVSVPPPPTQSVLTQESNGALSGSALDDALPSGGSNQG